MSNKLALAKQTITELADKSTRRKLESRDQGVAGQQTQQRTYVENSPGGTYTLALTGPKGEAIDTITLVAQKGGIVEARLLTAKPSSGGE